ncbi:MAG: hypothetical protein LM591_04445 [Candidatus Korarchaeum sp.]|nr:hypothetical protein [Candidatus Korarchaeum sp.]
MSLSIDIQSYRASIILLVAVALSSYILYRMRRTWIERALEEYLRAMGEEVDRGDT